MMATVPHVTSGLGLRKFQADGFLLTRVYNVGFTVRRRYLAFGRFIQLNVKMFKVTVFLLFCTSMRLVSHVDRSTLTEDSREQNDKGKYLELNGSKYMRG